MDAATAIYLAVFFILAALAIGFAWLGGYRQHQRRQESLGRALERRQDLRPRDWSQRTFGYGNDEVVR